MRISVTEDELHTVLAALAHWRRLTPRTTTAGTIHQGLNNIEMGALYERLRRHLTTGDTPVDTIKAERP